MASTCVWGKNETLKLIEIWGEDNVQQQLEECHRNREVYTRIARRMNDCGRVIDKNTSAILLHVLLVASLLSVASTLALLR